MYGKIMEEKVLMYMQKFSETGEGLLFCNVYKCRAI